MIKKKILAIVYRKRNNKEEFLTLKENNADKTHHALGFYVITGGVKGNESLATAVKREIKEETGIKKIINIQDLNTVYEYKHPAEEDYSCQECCFAVLVDDEVKHLSEEHTEYKWLYIEDFIDTMDWYYNKAGLKILLKQFIKSSYLRR